jgi:hypothetical protein
LFLLSHCIPPWSTTLESFRSLRKFSCGRSAFDETLSNHEVHEEHEGLGFSVIANFVFFVVISIVCSLRPARAYRNTPYNYNLFFASFAFFAVKFPFIFVNFVSFVVQIVLLGCVNDR